MDSMAVNATLAYQPNFIERQWLSLFEGAENPSIRLAVVLFAWHEFVFVARYIPYMIIDHIPYFRKYKIQADKEISTSQWIKCVAHVFFYQSMLQLPMMMAFHPVATALGMKFLEVPFPSLLNIAASTFFFMFMEDFYQYFVHRLMHWGILYKAIHKQHHEFSAPFGIASEYAHPLETLFLGLGFFLGPLIWVLVLRDLHIISVAIWLAVRLIQVVDAHSGYDFPWALRHILPFWAGADFHDYHHMAFVGNYSSSFRWWDWICGTDRAYQAWKDRNAAKKTQ
ncbi:C-4 sterol methyl oxidase [Polyrhizophydium stewartii]|uniref:C-4 sterol methyl oxidase n=1 Tax=Polyrhizophydium stewartii TaxID=2732419 RepID=A0ABR4NHL9_9FUNG|nr:C-4 sterol methyl oxidase [Polyrhizophydium stewartii]